MFDQLGSESGAGAERLDPATAMALKKAGRLAGLRQRISAALGRGASPVLAHEVIAVRGVPGGLAHDTGRPGRFDLELRISARGNVIRRGHRVPRAQTRWVGAVAGSRIGYAG